METVSLHHHSMDERFSGVPCLPCDELTILSVVDIYDGPISGIVRHQTGLYWFAWDSDGDLPPPRRYALHALSGMPAADVEAWAARHNALCGELRLVANPHVYPVSEWQRATMRSSTAIVADLEALDDLPLAWARLPVTAWFAEEGQAFAAIQTFTVDADAVAGIERWQHELADALAAEDQIALDRLFANPALPVDPLDIHWVTVNDRAIVRDWQGQVLPPDFILTSGHRVSNYSHLIGTR